MKRTWIRSASVVLSAMAMGVAGAQMSSGGLNGQSGVSGRIGFFLPTNSEAADAGHYWLAFGLDYRINSVNAPAMTMRSATGTFFTLSGDYYDKGSYRNIPIAINYNVRSQQLIFSAGVGGDIQTVNGNETIGLGGQLGITYEFGGKRMGNIATNMPFFIQAKYFLCNQSAVDGLGVYVGMRF